MKTNRQIFKQYLKEQGFHVSKILSTIQLVPHFYKDRDGNHNLITNISCCIWDDKYTKKGDLGCVTLYFSSICQLKHCHRAFDSELLKKVFCPQTAEEAIQTFELWRIESNRTIETWTLIQ